MHFVPVALHRMSGQGDDRTGVALLAEQARGFVAIHDRLMPAIGFALRPRECDLKFAEIEQVHVSIAVEVEESASYTNRHTRPEVAVDKCLMV